MSGNRPLGMIDYACGHSTPVRGQSATVNRPCKYCAAGPVVARVRWPHHTPSLPGGLSAWQVITPREESPQ